MTSPTSHGTSGETPQQDRAAPPQRKAALSEAIKVVQTLPASRHKRADYEFSGEVATCIDKADVLAVLRTIRDRRP